MKTRQLLTAFALSSGIFLSSTLVGWMKFPTAFPSADIERSVSKSFLLLQKSGYTFINRSKRKCASCHHNTLTSMAAELARLKGIPVIDSFTVHRVKAMERSLIRSANPNYTDEFITSNFVSPYLLLGLYAEKYPPNSYTDIPVDYLISQARPGGGFLAESSRTPSETGEIHLAAFAIHALQVYASPAKRSRVNELVAATRQWLEKAQPGLQQELVFQLLGMHWCGSGYDRKIPVSGKLISMQNADGGWSQLPTMKSDAYATGQALYALLESGMAKPEDAACQAGIRYLLTTQDESGAWVVETRAYPIQPFFNSDFPPYDENQFISAAATSWAVMALLKAMPDKTK